MVANVTEIPTTINTIKRKTDNLIKDICEYIAVEDLPPELAFLTLITLGFAMLYDGGIVGEKVAVDSATEIAKTVYSGEGLEGE